MRACHLALMASLALAAVGCVPSGNGTYPTDAPSQDGHESGLQQVESGVVAPEPHDASRHTCDATVGLYAYSSTENSCEAVGEAGCADDSGLFTTFEACAAKHEPELLTYCKQDSNRPADCRCGRSAQCEFECLAEIDVSLEDGGEASCRAMGVGICSRIPTPPGCYCVLGHSANGDDALDGASVICWEGVH